MQREGDPLTGPVPAWREGYQDEDPIYREVIRAMGIPGQGGPNGGDVLLGALVAQGEAIVAELDGLTEFEARQTGGTSWPSGTVTVALLPDEEPESEREPDE